MTSFAILLVLIAFDSTRTMAKGPGSGNSNSGVQSNDHQNSGSSGNNVSKLGSNASNSGKNVGNSGNNVSNSGSNAGNSPGFKFDKGMNSGKSMGQSMNSNKVFDANHKPEFSSGKEGRDSWRYRWDNGRWWFWGPSDQWLWYGDDGRWLNYGNSYVVNRPILDNFSGDPIKIVNPAKNGVTLNYTLNGSLFNIQPGYSQDLQADRAWVIQFSRGENLDQARYGLQPGVYTFARTDRGWELFHSELQQTLAPPAPIAAPTNPSIASPTNPPMATPTNPQ
jgi:hypothetical protein